MPVRIAREWGRLAGVVSDSREESVRRSILGAARQSRPSEMPCVWCPYRWEQPRNGPRDPLTFWAVDKNKYH